MKTKSIFKRKVNLSLLLLAVILTGVAGCKKGTFEVNDVNPNSPTSVPTNYTLSSALAGTANLVQGGNADVFDNWMGYWTQSGGYTASTTYVLYQLTSSNFTGNFDNAYLNLSNYNLLIKTAGSNPTQAYFKAIATIMQSFVYQRLVDEYNSVPYSQALTVNTTFSYKYDQPQDIYNSIYAKLDTAINAIKTNLANTQSTAVYPLNYDVVFGKGFKATDNAKGPGEMQNWIKFANTLKLKILLRQTEKGSPAVSLASAFPGATADTFLAAGNDGSVNPGYSNASDAQLNPFYYDVIGNSQASNGLNTVYWRANAYGVNFFKDNNDPRLSYVYIPISGTGGVAGTDKSKFAGRVYGSTSGTESNTVISAVLGTGYVSGGDGTSTKGASQDAELIPAFESLFLQAEATYRGALTFKTASVAYKDAVTESFRFLGVANYAAAATTYTSQSGNQLTNFDQSTDKLTTLITQKWAAMNSIDPLESYSDWRRLGIPANLPVSIYPGNTATHIPYRLPYPINETTLNSANVPTGGSGTDALTSKIFWMK
jgi:hypothetical protein